jgi:hypothetical protein
MAHGVGNLERSQPAIDSVTVVKTDATRSQLALSYFSSATSSQRLPTKVFLATEQKCSRYFKK